MRTEWRDLGTVKFPKTKTSPIWEDIKNFRARVVIDHAYRTVSIVLEGEVKTKPVDVTKECQPILCKSQQTTGTYIALMHEGKRIAILGMGDPVITNSEYDILMPPKATTSFQVFRR